MTLFQPGLCVVVLLAAMCHVQAAPLTVEALFKRPEYHGAAISPSGRYVALARAGAGERYNVSVIDLDTRTATQITSFPDGDVTRILWQTDERMLVFVGDLQRGTGEPPRERGVVAIDRDGRNPLPLSRRFGMFRYVYVIGGTNDILIASYRRGPSLDVYRVDTRTEAEKLLTFSSPGNVTHWVVDLDGVPRAATSHHRDSDKSAWYVRKSANDPWRKIEEDSWGGLKTLPQFFSTDGKILFVESRRHGDRAAIYEFDVDSGEWRPAIKHPERDMRPGFVFSFSERKLLGLYYADDRPAYVWFDAEWARIQKSVDAALPNHVNELQKGEKRWLVVARSDRNPGDVYLLDGKTMKMQKLLSYRPWIDPDKMAASRWTRYQARDGLTIPALLTIAKDSEGKRVPLVVYIRGRPYGDATEWGFQTRVQLLASRGYAVLQPQYRGTKGFGWNLHSAGFRKVGEEMQDDIEDAVKWAVAQGIADPDRVCLFGAGYGGYAAMWGAIKSANVIKCAVARSGPVSIEHLFAQLRRRGETAVTSEIMGDANDRERWRRVSPVDHAAKVGVPIFLAYGVDDRDSHGADFRRELERHGKPHEWMVYDEDGYGFRLDKHIHDFYARVERFLAKYLGAPR